MLPVFRWIRISVIVVVYLCDRLRSQGETDLVTDLPGLIFETNCRLYSGYVFADVERRLKMYYWWVDEGRVPFILADYPWFRLTESQSDSSVDPLMLWFNGGPGCSSFAAHFEELGPFFVNDDGETLYENVFAWNRVPIFSPILWIWIWLSERISFFSTRQWASDSLTTRQTHSKYGPMMIR